MTKPFASGSWSYDDLNREGKEQFLARLNSSDYKIKKLTGEGKRLKEQVEHYKKNILMLDYYEVSHGCSIEYARTVLNYARTPAYYNSVFMYLTMFRDEEVNSPEFSVGDVVTETEVMKLIASCRADIKRALDSVENAEH